MSAVHLCHQCDNVFVCVRSVVLTIVMQTLWDGQVSYKYVMNSKTFGRELLARPRVVQCVFCHERQEA